MKTTLALYLLLALVLNTGCTRSDGSQTTAPDGVAISFSFQQIDTPASPGSGEPNLHTTPGGEVLLSWIEPREEGGHALRFSKLEDDAWAALHTIAEGDDWFVNWADFPSLVALDDGALAAHFLAKSDAPTFAYDVHITRSRDGGRTWSPSVIPHRDGTPTEHGFVSMLPWHENRVFAAWLDGRNTDGGEGHDGHGSGGAMTLRAATLDPDGTLHDEALLDDRVCDCCQTSAARTSHGIIVAYRNRSEEEIRDISVVRLQDGAWSEPRTVHEDGWRIAGCPVNGPSVAATGEQVAIAWFTAAQDTPRVYLSFSPDAGRTFAPPVVIDDGRPIGRVDTILLADGSALVSWIEQLEDGAEIRLRRVSPEGTREEAQTVTAVAAARASGFPRMTRRGDTLVIAWTVAGRPSAVRSAIASLNG
ncbi:MAG: sialidase family protein [Rhodothermales bacterium]